MLEGKNLYTYRGITRKAVATPLTVIDGMPVAQFQKYLDKAVNARGATIYDTGRMLANKTLDKGALKLFIKSVEEEGRVWNDKSVSYTKDKGDTNLQTKGGRLEFGHIFLCYAMAVEYQLPVRSGVFDAFGRLTDATPQPKQSATYSAATLMQGLMNNLFVQFYRSNSKPQESGLAIEFPMADGTSAAVGGDTEEGIFQNTLGQIRYLDTVKALHWEEDWFVQVENVSALKITAGYPVRIKLIGLDVDTAVFGTQQG